MSGPPIPLLLIDALRCVVTMYHATTIIKAIATTPPTAPPIIPPTGNDEDKDVAVGGRLVVFLISQVHK